MTVTTSGVNNGSDITGLNNGNGTGGEGGNDACQASGVYNIHFNWTYSGSQTGYIINIANSNDTRVDGNGDFINPAWSRGSNNNPVSSSAGTTYVTIGSEIPYGQTYYWQVKICNSQTNCSNWYYGGTSATAPGQYFKTANHAWPHPDYQPSPVSATLIDGKAEVSFIDSSKCYQNGTQEIACNDRYYTWDFDDTNQNQNCNHGTGKVCHTYNAPPKAYNTSLTICDNEGCCTANRQATVKSPKTLPEWHEVSPF
jgi:hypothetical protein